MKKIIKNPWVWVGVAVILIAVLVWNHKRPATNSIL